MSKKTGDANSPQFVTVGRIGRSYGVKGWLKIQSFTVPEDNILDYSPWYRQVKNTWVPSECDGLDGAGKQILAHFKSYDSPEQAKLLTGQLIAIEASQLPALEQDEYYWRDLEGLEVKTLEGLSLGKVDHLIDNGVYSLLCIKGAKERIIPFIQGKIVKKVDLAEKIIMVEWDLDL